MTARPAGPADEQLAADQLADLGAVESGDLPVQTFAELVKVPPGAERNDAGSTGGPGWVDGVSGALGALGRLAASALTDVARDAIGPRSMGQVDDVLGFLRARLTGDFEVDEYGFDSQLTDVVLANLLRPLYNGWFRVEVRGIENLPKTGGALVVANHSGTVPIDAVMTQLAVLEEHPGHRHLRLLGADLVFAWPVVAELARASGATLACVEDATRLLGQGELVGVFPEGFKGSGKLFKDRYRLQRFGRGGFVSAAIQTHVPLVPCSIVGAEEAYPMLANAGTLARVLGLPYLPVTPTFPWLGPIGLIPLPSKWIIEFGTPIDTDQLDPALADDPAFVFDLTDQVRETIQQTLYRLLEERGGAFA